DGACLRLVAVGEAVRVEAHADRPLSMRPADRCLLAGAGRVRRAAALLRLLLLLGLLAHAAARARRASAGCRVAGAMESSVAPRTCSGRALACHGRRRASASQWIKRITSPVSATCQRAFVPARGGGPTWTVRALRRLR